MAADQRLDVIICKSQGTELLDNYFGNSTKQSASQVNAQNTDGGIDNNSSQSGGHVEQASKQATTTFPTYK